MLSLGRRSAAFVGGATCMAALAALVIATTPHSSAQGLGAAATNGGRTSTSWDCRTPAAGTSEAVRAGGGLPPGGLGVIVFALDGAEERAAVRDARHDAAGE